MLEEKMKELEREKKAGEKKISQLQTKMAKATADLKEEREVREYESSFLLNLKGIFLYFSS